MKNSENIKVFISYCWSGENGNQDEQHKEKVRALANFLIENSFDVILDVYKNQEVTSNEFTTMMHKAMTESSKVIIVLSKGYKVKAEKFEGGVGEEYRMIIKEIDEKINKFILFTFDGFDAPLKLSKRDTIKFESKDWENKLFAKLLDEKIYEVPQKGKEKPIITKTETKSIFDFVQNDKNTQTLKDIEELGKIKNKWVEKLLFFQKENVKTSDIEQKFSNQEKMSDIEKEIENYENQINQLKLG